MKRRKILLTCFGSKIAYEVVKDLEQKADIETFIADANPRAPISFVTPRFIHLPRGDDPGFANVLLKVVQQHGIEMVIPGGDEDAFALMAAKDRFDAVGVITAVQDPAYIEVFQSKRNQYEYLMRKGFPVPPYRCVKTENEFIQALDELKYPHRPLLMKPNAGRGGRGILLLYEKFIRSQDDLHLINSNLARQLLDGKNEFILMEYFEGAIYDIDVLKYADNTLYFGQRKRIATNVTKLFAGNAFKYNKGVDLFCKKLYDAFPTSYLIDYDLMVEKNGNIHLLEVNPRPSGSTISYIPFGVNLYYILAKSYLENQHVAVSDQIVGRSAFTFYKMIKDI